MAVTLLLLGRDGNGKSSIGNSILGRKFFTPKLSTQPDGGAIVSGSSQIDGILDIVVVDGPGIGDTNMDDPNDVKLTIEKVEIALKFCPIGFTAVIIVFKYGTRFTRQEKNTVSLIRDLFGERVFKDYGVIVMTNGDNYNSDNEDKTPFEVWCNAQTGDIKDLFKECGNRCVLFNNREKDEQSLRIQRDLLLNAVTKLQTGTNPYTWTEYMKAENGRKQVIVSAKKLELEKETNQLIEHIRTSLGCCDVDGNPQGAIDTIVELQKNVAEHKQHLEMEAEGTNLMKDLIVQVTLLESSLETKLMLAKQVSTKQEYDALEPAIANTCIMTDGHEHRQEVDPERGVVSVLANTYSSFCSRIRQLRDRCVTEQRLLQPKATDLTNPKPLEHKATGLTNPKPLEYNATGLTNSKPLKHKATDLNNPKPLKHKAIDLTNPKPLKHKATDLNNPKPLEYKAIGLTNPQPLEHKATDLTNPQPLEHKATGLTNPQTLEHKATGLTNPQPFEHKATGLTNPQTLEHKATGLTKPETLEHKATGLTNPQPLEYKTTGLTNPQPLE